MNRNVCQSTQGCGRGRQPLSCPSMPEQPAADFSSVPTGNQRNLFCYINEISFTISELLLYLDTHPCDQDALQYFKACSALRNYALEEYGKNYAPLTIDTANGAQSKSWQWMAQPWPWEGGMS